MQKIEEYILKPKKQRQAHLDLDEPCIERGGQSMYCKGLLAHILETTIPAGKKIHVCHACHNGKCSNPKHLYWGTAQENRLDAIENGAPTIWQAMVNKHGLEGAKAIQRRNSNPSKAGKGNLGTTKSEEHKRKIAESLKGRKRGRYKKARMAE